MGFAEREALLLPHCVRAELAEALCIPTPLG